MCFYLSVPGLPHTQSSQTQISPPPLLGLVCSLAIESWGVVLGDLWQHPNVTHLSLSGCATWPAAPVAPLPALAQLELTAGEWEIPPGAPQHVGDNGEEEGSQERQAGGECPGQGRRREASGGLGGGPWLSMPDAAAGTRPGAGMKQGREATAWLVVPTAAALAAPGRRGSRLSGFAAT